MPFYFSFPFSFFISDHKAAANGSFDNDFTKFLAVKLKNLPQI